MKNDSTRETVRVRLILTSGGVAAVRTDQGAKPVLSIGDRSEAGIVNVWLTIAVNDTAARAFGAHVGGKVRVTIEAIDDEPEAT